MATTLEQELPALQRHCAKSSAELLKLNLWASDTSYRTEAVRWRCYRSLVADALYAQGVEVRHITSRTRAEPHKLTPFAELHGRQVHYPGGREEEATIPQQ